MPEMAPVLRYAARSHAGLMREGNEDSGYAGPRLLAVADGMGGHAAGEVASAVAIAALAGLDSPHGPDGPVPDTGLLGALAAAVAGAGARLRAMIAADPGLAGMGTTLTAMLWSGRQAALCHIGDSRAYLLRHGQFSQVTHDHTLVQALVDEGQITPDAAATHPHRSLLLRTLDGGPGSQPDLSLHEARPGDRYLLCSDGLSGVVSGQAIEAALTAVAGPGEAAAWLIELANRAGGPDNITCVIADVTAPAAPPPGEVPVLAGAVSGSSLQP